MSVDWISYATNQRWEPVYKFGLSVPVTSYDTISQHRKSPLSQCMVLLANVTSRRPINTLPNAGNTVVASLYSLWREQMFWTMNACSCTVQTAGVVLLYLASQSQHAILLLITSRCVAYTYAYWSTCYREFPHIFSRTSAKAIHYRIAIVLIE